MTMMMTTTTMLMITMTDSNICFQYIKKCSSYLSINFKTVMPLRKLVKLKSVATFLNYLNLLMKSCAMSMKKIKCLNITH